jgi:hypothetical protein
MEPYRYLEQVSRELDRIRTRQQAETILDELEFLYDALDPEFQDLCADLIERLTRRLRELA